MKRDYKFKPGQKVRMNSDDYDDYNEVLNGVVTDTTTETVFIHWDKWKLPVEHPQSDYPKIWLNPKQ